MHTMCVSRTTVAVLEVCTVKHGSNLVCIHEVMAFEGVLVRGLDAVLVSSCLVVCQYLKYTVGFNLDVSHEGGRTHAVTKLKRVA